MVKKMAGLDSPKESSLPVAVFPASLTTVTTYHRPGTQMTFIIAQKKFWRLGSLETRVPAQLRPASRMADTSILLCPPRWRNGRRAGEGEGIL